MAQVNVPSAADIAECGELGVLTYNLTDLPEGVDPRSVRKCAGHPLQRITPEIAARDGAPAVSIMGKRDCWFGSPFGCTNNYYWKTCGSNGEWCWTARDGGFGAWAGCSTFQDCSIDIDCGQGDCGQCGCSC
ncbi:hypothetical protein E1B28_005305 [Marasmius oreades]|uniref:Uncharacterized protein n=1 Tax=Marasmius oreades TaxID=181124 RepID=A0A9P7V0H2_9AGAR|nr:uncharacterized protein E1B28_005305 [Marasmius oreades]KAG7097997.1 hypothetical protein E1B28_005305 [Marasmius oreades]